MCVASFGSVVFAPSEQQLSILFDILEATRRTEIARRK
jgi:hypothetical protein